MLLGWLGFAWSAAMASRLSGSDQLASVLTAAQPRPCGDGIGPREGGGTISNPRNRGWGSALGLAPKFRLAVGRSARDLRYQRGGRTLRFRS